MEGIMKKQGEMLTLIRKVHFRFAKYFSRKCAEKQVTLPQYMLLLSLMEGGPQKMNSLAKLLRISTPSVTNLVDKLESANYVKRVSHPTDRRAHIIELTPPGTRFVRDLQKDTFVVLSSTIGGMSAFDQEALKTFYKDLINRFDTAFEKESG
jgi:DNA-binding MarR family transcriptional regulator